MLAWPCLRGLGLQGACTLVVCGPSDSMSQHYCGLIRRGLAVLSALPAQATPVAGDDAVHSLQEAQPKEALLYVAGGGALECALACALEQCMAWARGHAMAVDAGTTCTADAARNESPGAHGTGGAASCTAEPAGDDGGTAFDFAALVSQLMCAIPRYKPPPPPPPHAPTDTAAPPHWPAGPHGPAGSQAAGVRVPAAPSCPELPLLPTAMRAEVGASRRTAVNRPLQDAHC